MHEQTLKVQTKTGNNHNDKDRKSFKNLYIETMETVHTVYTCIIHTVHKVQRTYMYTVTKVLVLHCPYAMYCCCMTQTEHLCATIQCY